MITHLRFPRPTRTLVTWAAVAGTLTARRRTGREQRSVGERKGEQHIFFAVIRRLACLISLVCLSGGFASAQSDYRCQNVKDPGSGIMCETVGCRIQRVGPNQAFCATATDFVLRDLKPGEQMCCTATEAIVRTVGPEKCLLCDRVEGQLFDRAPETDFAHFPDYCCTADKCMSIFVNLYNDERGVCNAFKSLIVANVRRKTFGVACNNNNCYQALLHEGEQLACKRFNVTP